MVGEMFPWKKQESEFACSFDSHNSVLGIRGYATTQYDAIFSLVSAPEMTQLEKLLHKSSFSSSTPSQEVKGTVNHLFAFPAECNFTGTKHDLAMIKHVQQHGLANHRPGKWAVLLDAAKFVATSPLDLMLYQPDFMVCSFYKIFGYPTGLGALLIKKNQSQQLFKKVYFGGGTVQGVLASKNVTRPRENPCDYLQDGTISFLTILSLKHGLDMINKISMFQIQHRTFTLTNFLLQSLRSLKHFNGVYACRIYGHEYDVSLPESKKINAQGPIVACNFIQDNGSFVGYAEFEKMANINGIQVRTGCFCNPGACQYYLHLDDEEVLNNMSAGHVCWDDMDIVNGKPIGSIRISLGYMSTFDDIIQLLNFINQNFIVKAISSPLLPKKSMIRNISPTAKRNNPSSYIEKISFYPIKSCAAVCPQKWILGERGLLYDREWAVIDSSGKVLRQKDISELCFIQPVIDIEKQTLSLSHYNMPCPLVIDINSTTTSMHIGQLNVCGEPCEGNIYSKFVSDWLSECLSVTCYLARIIHVSPRFSHCSIRNSKRQNSSTASTIADANSESTKISFANEGQFLLISSASVWKLNSILPEKDQITADIFRANFVVSGCTANSEDDWEKISIGNTVFRATGKCGRCSMINIDQATGVYKPASLKTLASYRRKKSNIFFGLFISYEKVQNGDKNWISIGDRVDVIQQSHADF